MPILENQLVTVVGGGLAGCEAAWQLAERGVGVRLVEMRPDTPSPAHQTGELAELVCSNSLKGQDAASAAGTLKRELELLDSLILAVARHTAVPAGAALAVDRTAFSEEVTRRIVAHPLIDLLREEATALPSRPVVLATGPLTSPGFERTLTSLVGNRLSFFDAAAPIVAADSLDRSVVFAASRYDKGGGADYLNAPMDRSQYEAFVDALVSAERVILKDFERRELFSACQPIEEIARSSRDAIRFGALKPVGLTDPTTGERPYAVAQLRPEMAHGAAYNLVGFQTNLTFREQQRVFRLIPGLEHAEFLRYGVMHRNTFVDAPRLLTRSLELRARPGVWVAGQLSGTEGYLEAAASGLLAGLAVFCMLRELPEPELPDTSAFGALVAYATDPNTAPYQPMHVNFGLLPPLEGGAKGKRERYAAYGERAVSTLAAWLAARPELALSHGGRTHDDR